MANHEEEAKPPLPLADLDAVLSETEPLWEEVRGESLFITGGTGFFGAWLVESFTHANERLGLNARAVILTRRPDEFLRKLPHLKSRPGLELLKGDIRDFVFPAGEFRFVIHAATEASAKLNSEAPEEMVSTIIHGTERVLAFAGQAGTKKLLLTSSGAVYGRQPSSITHVPEEYEGGPDPLAPGSAYGEGKRISEHLCVLAGRRHGFEVKIARCFAFVGPHLPLDAHFAVGNFIRDILRGTPIQIGGDGTPYRSYLYAADLAIWLWTLLFRAPDSRAYNVGAAEDLTIAQIAAAVRDALKPDAEVRLASQPVQGGQPSRYVPSVLRAERELGLRASRDLATAIKQTACWYGWKP